MTILFLSITMKFFFVCTCLVFFFAHCQGRPISRLSYLKDTIASVVNSSKIINEGLADDIEEVTSDLEKIRRKVNEINVKIIISSLTDSLANLVDNSFKIFEYPNEGISAVEDGLRVDKRVIYKKFQNVLHKIGEEAIKQIEDITGKDVEELDLIEEVQDGLSKLVDDFFKSFDIAGKRVKKMKETLLGKKDEISDELKKRISELDLSSLGEKQAWEAMKGNPLHGLLVGIGQLVSGVGNKLGSVLQETKAIKDDTIAEINEKGRVFLDSAKTFMLNLAEKYTKDEDKVDRVKDAMEVILRDKISTEAEVVRLSYDNMLYSMNLAQHFVLSTTEEILGLVTSTDKAITDLAVGSLKGIYGGLTNILNLKIVIANKAEDLLQHLGPKLINRMTSLVNNVDFVGGNVISAKQNEIQETTDAASSFMTNTIERVKLLSEGTQKIGEHISDSRQQINSVIQGFVRLLFGDIPENDRIGFDALKDVLERYNSMAMNELRVNMEVPAE